jgi:type IV pilus assembly protein PilA
VELLIVVAMIGVLAALALMGYRKYMNSAQASEAKAVIQSIRNAEEAYKAETLVYLGCSASLTSYYPMAVPNDRKSAWANPGNSDFACWNTLNVVTDGPVRFGYAVMAGLPGAVGATPSLSTPVTWPNPATDPWYVVQAAGDRDNNGTFAIFVSASFTGEIMSENDFE